MSNIISVDFARRKRRKRLTLQAQSSIVKGPLPKESISGIKAALDRINKLLEDMRNGDKARPNREQW